MTQPAFTLDPARLAAAVRRGERPALARALNLLDDRRDNSRRQAAEFLKQLQAAQNNIFMTFGEGIERTGKKCDAFHRLIT